MQDAARRNQLRVGARVWYRLPPARVWKGCISSPCSSECWFVCKFDGDHGSRALLLLRSVDKTDRRSPLRAAVLILLVLVRAVPAFLFIVMIILKIIHFFFIFIKFIFNIV